MTNSNQTVTSASTASRTTQIHHEIEATKDAIDRSLWVSKNEGLSDISEKRAKAERAHLRRVIKRLRAEYNAIAFEASLQITQPVCQKHQQIVAGALSQFTVDAQVDGIFSHHNTHAARKVLKALTAAGYKIVKARAQ